MSGAEIKAIVDHLRAPPFNRTEGLVDFSKKSPLELLQVVNDVFAAIDEGQRRDLREEAKEQTAIRMLEFVTVLGYKIEGDIGQFGENFMRGNPLVIYPFLHWVLESFEKHKTRGYLARYLRPFSIPEEHFADNQIVNMYQQYQTYQSEFKEVHMQAEAARSTASNPAHLQQEVTQLANEKEQLVNKLEKLNARIANDPEYSRVNFPEMLHITNLLRQEQELESKLYQDAAEQRARLQHAEHVRNMTARKFQEMNHADMSRMDPQKLLAKLREEVAQRREYLDQKVEGTIAEREKQLKHLARMASSSHAQEYTAQDLQHLGQEKYDLEQHVDHLLQQRANSAAASDSKITFVRDRLANVETKKEKLRAQVAELEDEKAELEKDLKKVQAEFKALTSAGANEDDASNLLPNGQPRPKTEAAMKEYMNELNRKTQKYKALKAELEAERGEVAILARTETILRSRDTNLAEFNAAQEKRLGVQGFLATQETLEAVAASKNQVDAAKGETLEEMSETVARIEASLKKQKERLAPKIKELRAVRTDFEAIEAVYKMKRAQYEAVALGFESERLKLEQDVQAHQHGVQEEESQFHFLQCFAAVTAARAAQVAKLDTVHGPAYEKAISEQEATTKTLRAEKKRITEKHDEHVAQRAMFRSLRGILRKKLEIASNQGAQTNNTQQQQPYGGGYQQQGGYGQQSYSQQGGGYNSNNQYLDQLAEESDRMVFE